MSDERKTDALKYTELYQQLKQMEDGLNFVFLTTKRIGTRLKQVNFLQSLDFILVDPNDKLMGQDAMRFVPMDIFPNDKVDNVKISLVKIERDMDELEIDDPVESYLQEFKTVLAGSQPE